MWALTALGVVLRFATLDLQSYWSDEAATVFLIRESFGGMVAQIYAYDSTPPLYYAAAWGWARVFGDGEIGLRSLSALAGVLTIPVAYGAGKELVSRRAGVVTAALVATSPALVWYSQEARAYALLLLFSALSLLFFARARRTSHPADLAGWALCSFLAVATHYLAAVLVVIEAVLLLAGSPHRRRVAVAATALGVAILALAPLALAQVKPDVRGWITAVSLERRLTNVLGFFVTGERRRPGEGVSGVAGAIVMLYTVGAAFWLGKERERRGGLVALGLGVSMLAIAVAAAFAGLDYVSPRYLLLAWIPLAIAVASGLSIRRIGPAGAAIAACICIGFLYFNFKIASQPSLHRDNWRAVATALGPSLRDQVVVVVPPWNTLALMVYRPDLRPMLGHRGASAIWTVMHKHPGDPRASVQLPASFREDVREKYQQIRVTRYTGSGLTPVAPGSLSGHGLHRVGALANPEGREVDPWIAVGWTRPGRD